MGILLRVLPGRACSCTGFASKGRRNKGPALGNILDLWGASKRECLPGRAVGKRVLVGAFAWMGGSKKG